MNRRLYQEADQWESMPHVCGDEPLKTPSHGARVQVCPTYVGMNRTEIMNTMPNMSMPHVCGDEPESQLLARNAKRYAPRMWG